MTNLLIGIGIGLIVGWNLLPQPTAIKNIYDSIAAKIKGLTGRE